MLIKALLGLGEWGQSSTMLWSFWRCARLLTSSGTSLSTWTTLWLEHKWWPLVCSQHLWAFPFPTHTLESIFTSMLRCCKINFDTSYSDPEHNDNAFLLNWSDSTSEKHELVIFFSLPFAPPPYPKLYTWAMLATRATGALKCNVTEYFDKRRENPVVKNLNCQLPPTGISKRFSTDQTAAQHL